MRFCDQCHKVYGDGGEAASTGELTTTIVSADLEKRITYLVLIEAIGLDTGKQIDICPRCLYKNMHKMFEAIDEEYDKGINEPIPWPKHSEN